MSVEHCTIDKKQAIMQTVERLFSNRRIHEITLDEVAQKAKVGKGTIYRYFEDKDDLFFQVATSGFDELCEVLRAKVPQEGPFAGRLLEMGLAINAFFDQRREMLQVMQAEDARMPGCKGKLRERWFKHRKRLVKVVTDILRDGVSTGVVRDDIDPEVMAQLLLSMFRARAQDLREFPENARPHHLVVNVFLNGCSGRNKSGR